MKVLGGVIRKEAITLEERAKTASIVKYELYLNTIFSDEGFSYYLSIA